MSKIQRTIICVGVPELRIKRAKLYLELLADKLTDKWQIVTGNVQSDLLLLDLDFFESHLVNDVDPELTILCYKETNTLKVFNNTLRYPIESNQLLKVLNRISHSGKLKAIDKNEEKRSKNKTFAFFSKKIKPQIPAEHIQTQKSFSDKLKDRLKTANDKPYKIILLGGPGSGKSVALRAISESTNDDVAQDDASKNTKASDSVIVSIESEKRIKLINTPDDVQKGYTWDTLSMNADGFVILLNMRHFDPIEELQTFLQLITEKITQKTVLGCALIYHEKTHHNIDKIKQQIKQRVEFDIPINGLDPRKKINVVNLLNMMARKLHTKD